MRDYLHKPESCPDHKPGRYEGGYKHCPQCGEANRWGEERVKYKAVYPRKYANPKKLKEGEPRFIAEREWWSSCIPEGNLKTTGIGPTKAVSLADLQRQVRGNDAVYDRTRRVIGMDPGVDRTGGVAMGPDHTVIQSVSAATGAVVEAWKSYSGKSLGDAAALCVHQEDGQCCGEPATWYRPTPGQRPPYRCDEHVPKTAVSDLSEDDAEAQEVTLAFDNGVCVGVVDSGGYGIYVKCATRDPIPVADGWTPAPDGYFCEHPACFKFLVPATWHNPKAQFAQYGCRGYCCDSHVPRIAKNENRVTDMAGDSYRLVK